jgi:type III pantothenate kinase
VTASEEPYQPLGGRPRWLLIGNSRWHWAAAAEDSGTLHCWHTAPPLPAELQGGALDPPLAWAAVGAIPEPCPWPQAARVRLEEVPLAGVPPWLGIDRALAGWQAWRAVEGPVLVADAGTVLSLTLVDGRGVFQGGRLLAGLALQLRAMAGATEHLPPAEGPNQAMVAPAWPRDTREAMAAGVQRGLAAAVAAAHLEAERDHPGIRLVLTGGDGALLRELLPRPGGSEPRGEHRPDLCLEALAALRPAST